MAGDEEEIPFVDKLLVRVEGRLDGRIARAGNGSCGQAADPIGVVQFQHVLRDRALFRPAVVLGRGGVPEVVVLHVLRNVAAGVGFQLVLGPQRVVGLQPVVEAGADLGVFFGHAGLLLDEAGQLDYIVQGGALLRDGIGQRSSLFFKLGVEGVHIIVDVLIGINVVGLREEVALALHQAAVVGDLVPETVLAEIGAVQAVGAAEEGIHAVHQTGVHEDLGHAHRRSPLRDGNIRCRAAGLLGESLDDAVVVHAGAQRKVAVLDTAGLAAELDILLEEPVILDDARLFQLGGNSAHRGALFHRDGLLLAQNAAAVHLVIEAHDLEAAKGQQRHKDHKDHAAHRDPPPGTAFLFLRFWFFLSGGPGRFRLFLLFPGLLRRSGLLLRLRRRPGGLVPCAVFIAINPHEEILLLSLQTAGTAVLIPLPFTAAF